ncbi:hypothetical protein VTN00DRAFT_1341 [Thermoascus crustaceus]|uniref:uncharacterized protein n=1 Tax=Thermoascus crustaceus TaxID=5088 RepID=UPI003744485C
MNCVLLCSLCQAAFDDLFNPSVVFFPQYLDYFIEHERIDRQRLLQGGSPREAAIGTINDAAIPRETRQKLLELLELYREPIRPETETHDDGKGKDRAPPGGGAGKGDGDDDGEDGGEGRTEQRKKRKDKEPAESSAKKKPRRSEGINKPVVKAAEHSEGNILLMRRWKTGWITSIYSIRSFSTVQSVQGQEVC